MNYHIIYPEIRPLLARFKQTISEWRTALTTEHPCLPIDRHHGARLVNGDVWALTFSQERANTHRCPSCHLETSRTPTDVQAACPQCGEVQ